MRPMPAPGDATRSAISRFRALLAPTRLDALPRGDARAASPSASPTARTVIYAGEIARSAG